MSLIEIGNFPVCTLCYKETSNIPVTTDVLGLITCYFCDTQVTTGHLVVYKRMMFQSPDINTIIIVTKIKDGLFFHGIENKEVVDNYMMDKSEYHKIPSSIFQVLMPNGFIVEEMNNG